MLHTWKRKLKGSIHFNSLFDNWSLDHCLKKFQKKFYTGSTSCWNTFSLWIFSGGGSAQSAAISMRPCCIFHATSRSTAARLCGSSCIIRMPTPALEYHVWFMIEPSSRLATWIINHKLSMIPQCQILSCCLLDRGFPGGFHDWFLSGRDKFWWMLKNKLFKEWKYSSEICRLDSKHLQAFLISFSSPCIFWTALDWTASGNEMVSGMIYQGAS